MPVDVVTETTIARPVEDVWSCPAAMRRANRADLARVRSILEGS
jgi:hypothetical protein